MITYFNQIIDRFNGKIGYVKIKRTAKINVDGTNFRINNQMPFSTDWYSHKFNGPGIRYEVATCIQTGNIVWIHGPFMPGKFSDIMIFRDKLKGMLEKANEKAEADDGYRGEPDRIRLPRDFVSDSDFKAKKKQGQDMKQSMVD